MQKMLVIDGNALETTGTTMLIVSFALGSLIGEAVNLEAGHRKPGRMAQAQNRQRGRQRVHQCLCLDIADRLHRCHGYRGINPRRLARRLVHARPQGRVGLRHRLHHRRLRSAAAASSPPCPLPYSRERLRCLPARSPPIMTAAALDSLSLVGSMLIFCVGVSLIRPQTFRTANMLPSVVIAVVPPAVLMPLRRGISNTCLMLCYDMRSPKLR